MRGDRPVTRAEDRARFVMLAEKRVSRALNDIRLIGNLSNRSNYSYTEDDARKIYKVLKDAVEDLRSKFELKRHEKHSPFKLD